MKSKNKQVIAYPGTVCSDCGTKWGTRKCASSGATWHYGHCGVCGKYAAVTEPRDFGHLVPGWTQDAPYQRIMSVINRVLWTSNASDVNKRMLAESINEELYGPLDKS
jgi:hypothetical protein